MALLTLAFVKAHLCPEIGMTIILDKSALVKSAIRTHPTWKSLAE
jgi:hypothetical protein